MVQILLVVNLALCLQAPQPGQDDLLHRLVEKLRSDSVAERNDAERELFRLGKGMVAVEALVKAASDKDIEVASRAKRVLRMIKVRETVPARLRAAFPGIEDRLAVDEDDRAWGGALFSVVNFAHRPEIFRDSLEVEDADFLVARALRGSRSEGGSSQVAAAAWVLGLRSAIPELVRLMGSPDPNDGQIARRALVLLQADEAVPSLLKLVEEGDPARSAIARRTLVELGALQAGPALIALLRDPRPHVRENAAMALGDLRIREAAGPLVERLAAQDPIDGKSCIRALGLLEAQAAVPALMKLLESPAAELASEAATALGAIGAKEAAPLLLKALEEPRAREAAIEALGRLGRAQDAGAVARHLESADEGVVRSAVGALGRLGDRSHTPALRKLLLSASASAAVRKEAAVALGALGDAASMPALVEALDHDEIRGAAFKAIGRLNPQGEVHSLVALLENPEKSESARRAAALLLARQGCPAAWEALLAVARRPEENAEVRQTAVFSLSGSSDERHFAPLVELLRDKDLIVRMSAAKALGARGEQKALPALCARMDDPNESSDVKGACALALGALNDPAIVRPLLRRLDDPRTAYWCAFGLGRQRATEAVPGLLKMLVSENPWGTPHWARAFRTLDRQAGLAALRGLLTVEDRWRRGAVAQGLCVLGSEEGVSTLLREARRNPKLRLTVLNALRKPEIWDRLELRFVPLEFPDLSIPREEAIELATGLPLERNPWETPKTTMFFGVRRDWMSALDVLDLHEEGWILEEGKIRILGRGQEFRFWTEWAASRAGKPR